MESGGGQSEPISVHDFSEKLLEQVVHFHVMKLRGGFFLWVGSSPVLSNVAVSMNSKFVLLLAGHHAVVDAGTGRFIRYNPNLFSSKIDHENREAGVCEL
ncbi:proteasome assembly chaperone 4 isoform X2 [Astyanax mexicanus]|uniref:proteasome assembly chaperone 4 isoform X2 n=1 Tax=Astyanax mexicanus TaxID=7994 RepID=UPI000440EBCB|nr:proteasome assembly chaperone 4 isoform X2 [Astyanax mexicanus]